MVNPKDSIENFKSQFLKREGIHLNSAGQSPVSSRVVERVMATLSLQERFASKGDSTLIAELIQARMRLAEFLGARETEVSYASNVATAVSQAALGFPLKKGDAVLTLDQEYSSNAYPWKVACERSGASFRTFQSEEDGSVDQARFMEAIQAPVKIVAVSWVQFQTGSILDLKSLGERCHSVGAYLVVDGIQALGQLPFSFRDLPVDFVSGAAHKWMCSLLGQGFFAVKPEFMNQLNPLLIGAGTFNGWGKSMDQNPVMNATASRFEPGGLAFVPLFALDSAIQLLQETGMDQIEAEIHHLSRRLREGILSSGVSLSTPLTQRGGTSSFRLSEGREHRFLEQCRDRGIAIMKRGAFIRISPHAFCTESEIDLVLEVLKESES